MLKNTKKCYYWLSGSYKESAKKVQKKCTNIWSIQKKAVPLHSLSPQNRENAEKRWFEAPEKLKQFDLWKIVLS